MQQEVRRQDIVVSMRLNDVEAVVAAVAVMAAVAVVTNAQTLNGERRDTTLFGYKPESTLYSAKRRTFYYILPRLPYIIFISYTYIIEWERED